jgi:predicted TIM-barrel fold metal-dependent hydrolase
MYVGMMVNIISMCLCMISGWHENVTKEIFLKSLVKEVISLFGADRCMFGSNHHINNAVSDSGGGLWTSGPSMTEKFQHFQSWVCDELSQQHQDCLFYKTAADFYRL